MLLRVVMNVLSDKVIGGGEVVLLRLPGDCRFYGQILVF
jgi:hypothetical protein